MRACACVSVCVRVSVCLSSLVCVVGLFLCPLMRYIGFMGVLFFMLNWMLQHDCLDTYCFLSVLYACVFYFCICTCSVQLSMFQMEKRSRNTLIIIIVIIIGTPVRQTALQMLRMLLLE